MLKKSPATLVIMSFDGGRIARIFSFCLPFEKFRGHFVVDHPDEESFENPDMIIEGVFRERCPDVTVAFFQVADTFEHSDRIKRVEWTDEPTPSGQGPGNLSGSG